MRHPKFIEWWKGLTPEQRLREFFALMEMNHRFHLSLPKKERERRNRVLLERHDRDEGHHARGAPARYRTRSRTPDRS